MNWIKKLHKPLLALLLLTPSLSHAWWNDQWPYRLPIGIDTSVSGANLKSNAADATVLVKLHTGNFEDFFVVKEDLSDVRFVGDDDKTPLKFHVEHVDLVNQLIYIWVKVPQVAGGINTGRIWMYYGNAQAPAAQDAAGSFDASTALALHFDAQCRLPPRKLRVVLNLKVEKLSPLMIRRRSSFTETKAPPSAFG